MRRLALLLALGLLSPAFPAFAQTDDDKPEAYDDDSGGDRGGDEAPSKKKKKSKKQRRDDDFRVVEDEAAAREETMAHVDDPNIGIGGELMAGVSLYESSRGALWDPRFAWGARVTWEFGRLIPDETLREMFFVDIGWKYGAIHDGTTGLFTDTNLHDFFLAPAVALPVGPKSDYAFYAQLGAGLNYDFSSVHVNINNKAETTLSGTKFLMSYGLGFRGRPAVLADGSMRLCFRIEITRTIRGYMHDTFIAAGAGLIF